MAAASRESGLSKRVFQFAKFVELALQIDLTGDILQENRFKKGDFALSAKEHLRIGKVRRLRSYFHESNLLKALSLTFC